MKTQTGRWLNQERGHQDYEEKLYGKRLRWLGCVKNIIKKLEIQSQNSQGCKQEHAKHVLISSIFLTRRYKTIKDCEIKSVWWLPAVSGLLGHTKTLSYVLQLCPVIVYMWNASEGDGSLW